LATQKNLFKACSTDGLKVAVEMFHLSVKDIPHFNQRQ